MRRRQFLHAGLGLASMCGAVCEANAKALYWRQITFTGLGTVLSIRAAHESQEALDAALAKARQTVQRIEDEMSLFRPESALSRLNASGVLMRPSADLLQVLRLSQLVSSRSGGAFDVTVQPLWRVYAQSQQEGRLPSAAEVVDAQRRVGWQRLQISDERIAFTQPGMGVSLNGVAQGYAADAVRLGLKREGVAHALIHTGEWSAMGMAPDQRPWTLGIANPRDADAWLARVAMTGLSVATSADDQCVFSADRVHHHIFDPHTGYSPCDVASVTVAAPSCAMADALTKVLFVQGYARALPLAKAWGVQAMVVHKSGEWQATSNFLLRG